MAERSKAPDSNSDDGDASADTCNTTAAAMETSGFVGSNPTSDEIFFIIFLTCFGHFLQTLGQKKLSKPHEMFFR